MKTTGKEPRLLPTVLEAIAAMREKDGSTHKQIIDHVTHTAIKTRVTVEVQRALEHAVNKGLIKYHRGKYALWLDKEEYAALRRKSQSQNLNAITDRSSRRCRSSKQEKVKRNEKKSDSRTRGRRGWRQNSYPDEETSESRRSKRSNRGPSEQGERQVQVESIGNKANDEMNDPCQSQPEEKNQPQLEKKESQLKTSSTSIQNNDQESKASHEHKDHYCGNPDCLCTINYNDSNLN